MDEHRIGLQPIIRKLWAPIGKRPQLAVYPRYKWLYIYGFVCPEQGKTDWFLLPRVNTASMNAALEAFALKLKKESKDKHIILVMDRASWHTTQSLKVPDNVTIVYQPAYSPEVQPAEHLWQYTDAPLVNQCPDSLEDVEKILTAQCEALQKQPERIRQATLFSWWPLVN